MPKASAEIVENRGTRLPFKVIFWRDGEVVAERPVASSEGGQRLINQLLPLLQRYEDR